MDYTFFACSEKDRLKFAAHGCDKHSIMLIRVFSIQSMNEFGVVSPQLRAITKQPKMPAVEKRLNYESPSVKEMVYL